MPSNKFTLGILRDAFANALLPTIFIVQSEEHAFAADVSLYLPPSVTRYSTQIIFQLFSRFSRGRTHLRFKSEDGIIQFSTGRQR